MTEPDTPKLYVDACVFIELGAFSRGWHKPEREADVIVFKQMLGSAEDKKLELFTSTVSIAECCHVKDTVTDTSNHKTIYDMEIQQFFVNLLSSGSMIQLVQDSVFVTESARDLLWKHGLKFGSIDGIHIASALKAGCSEFLTFDGLTDPVGVAKLEKLGLRISAPGKSLTVPPIFRATQSTQSTRYQ